MNKERKYPCEAIVKKASAIPGLIGRKITVLTEAKYWSCCCRTAHAVELPDGFPDPPGGCDYWVAETNILDFL